MARAPARTRAALERLGRADYSAHVHPADDASADDVRLSLLLGGVQHTRCSC
jgi:hypothetical protein